MSDPIFSLTSTNPFGSSDVGGANPSFVDIDGDGDMDAFVGNTLFFKNTGTASNPQFAAAITNPFGLSNVGESVSPTFVDIDSDGDADAFMGNGTGNTLFFRNTGTASIPLFGAPQTNSFGLSDVGYSANPTFVDIDGDGDLDAFVGNSSGYIMFFRNTGTASIPVFAAAPETNPFGSNYMSGYISPTFVDIDGDGDLDAFIGIRDHYNGEGGLFFYRNTGTASNPVFYRDSMNPFGLNPGRNYFDSAVFVDIDGDDDIDAFHYSQFFENTGPGYDPNINWGSSFGLDVDYYRHPTFVDIDDDGDMDAFVGSYSGDTLFFRNTGTASTPAFAAAITNSFSLSNVGENARPTFIDIDGDDDLDAFVGNDAGNTLFFDNTGTISNPVFAAPIINPFGLSDIGVKARPTFLDIDADNDQDIFINNMYFENTGTKSNPVFGLAQTGPFGLSGSSSFEFRDVDGDGDLDAFSASLLYSYEYGFFRNTGTANHPVFSPEISPFGLPYTGYRSNFTSQTFVDIDGDGDFDAYVTGISSVDSYAFPWNNFLINNNAPNVANLNANEIYSNNTLLNLTDIVISDPDSANVTATLTLSNLAAGSLSTATSGAVTSTFNAGTWTASGALADVNTLLAGLIFTPAFNFSGAFTINTSISDGVAAPLLGSKNFSVLLVSTPGNNILTGTSFDNDTVTYASATAAVTVSLLITTQQNTIGAGLDTLISVENLIGGAFNDNLTGNAANNVLDGRAGNDILSGWSGADTLIGGLGNDSYFVENTKDIVLENPNQGTDTVSSRLTYTLSVNVENLIQTGTAAVNGTGNSLNNVITGNNAANQLNGDAGNDTLNGDAGDDTLIGWSGADNMLGGLGNDSYLVENAGDVVTENLNQGTDIVSSRLTYTLPANVENLTLTGTSAVNGTGNGQNNVITGNNAANQLNGGAGNDMLNGGNGNDILNGSTGTNTLTGGTGNDIFKLTTTGHIDTITDYNVANDTIQLENAVFTALTTTGTLAAGQFRIGTQALDANDFIIYNNLTGALFYDANGSGAGAPVQIATVGVGLAMTNADIFVI